MHSELVDVIGLGVAGNFTGHLEQAGEASDFVHVKAAQDAPKGVFPFYVPGGGAHFLNRFPLDSRRIQLADPGERVQPEPELGLLCALEYDAVGVNRILPVAFGAYDDCSIRRPGARKISEKKNWGAATKGLSETLLPLDRFAPGGVLDRFRLGCWLERTGTLHAYGVDSPLVGYSYFYQQLLDWLVDRLRTQRDDGPLEDIAALLAHSGRPTRALISVGATRYTEFGESNFLEPGDVAHVVVYDATLHTADTLQRGLLAGKLDGPGLSVLSQRAAAAP
jgi:hypothetical protein